MAGVFAIKALMMQITAEKLYRADQVRELDRLAIAGGISGYELMNRAGQAAFRLIRERYPESRNIVVYCGRGNNAGDAYIVARLALQAGLPVRVFAVASPEKLSGDAATACQSFIHAGGKIALYRSEIIQTAEALIVDGLLGTGLNREVSGIYAEAILQINRSVKPVVALDIPSGLHADTGKAMGCTVRAASTITFIGRKQGLYTGDAAEYCGTVIFSGLDVPEAVYQTFEPASRLLQAARMPKRHRCAHKGDNGHVLIVGGDTGFSGAARMAAEAAARVGAGLVSVATRRSHAGILNMGCPELMCHAVERADELQVLLEKANVVVLGPGLGQTDWAIELFNTVLSCTKPLLLDADALNLLACRYQRNRRWLLTPHPGEAARLLGQSVAEVQRDRFVSVSRLQEKYRGTIVLKGSGTLIHDGQTVHVSSTGNPGMASGGFGDVLSGVIAGLIAQGVQPEAAAYAGVYWHGKAADQLAEQGERGLLASDLMPCLRALVNTA